MTRLLFLTERFPPDIGGLSASSRRIAQSLSSLGLEIDVLAWSRHVPAGKLVEQQLDQADSENLRIYRQGQYRQWDMTMPATLNAMNWLHQQNKYEAIWGHYLSPAGFLAVWFGKLHEIPSTISARGNDIDTEMFPPGDFSRLMWTLQNAKLISAVSKNMAHKIQILSGRNDVFVLPNSVDISQFAARNTGTAQLRTALGIEPGELIIGFAGELREKKGIQFLLDTFRDVRTKHACRLLVIGDVRNQQRPTMQLFAAEFPEDFSKIIITGHKENPLDVAELLNLCDLFLLPSLMEGMPNSLLEAMACARLCIASDAGGIPELIKHGENGFIVPCPNLNHLSTAVLEAFELNEQTKLRITQSARQTVLDSFDLEAERAHLDALLKILLDNPEYASKSNLPVRSRQ